MKKWKRKFNKKRLQKRRSASGKRRDRALSDITEDESEDDSDSGEQTDYEDVFDLDGRVVKVSHRGSYLTLRKIVI